MARRTLVGQVAILAVPLFLAACSVGASPSPSTSPSPSPSPSTSPSPSPSSSTADRPVHAEITDGLFRLTLDLPQTTWHTSDSVTGTLTLAYLGAGGIDLGGSGGGLIASGFVGPGGRPRITPAMTADCRPYRLEAGRPVTRALTKSGGFSADDPDADFFRSFFADPGIHLTPGEWTVISVASFLEGTDCGGASHDFHSSVTIHVEP